MENRQTLIKVLGFMLRLACLDALGKDLLLVARIGFSVFFKWQMDLQSPVYYICDLSLEVDEIKTK